MKKLLIVILVFLNLVTLGVISFFINVSLREYLDFKNIDILYSVTLPLLVIALVVILCDILAIKRNLWRWATLFFGIVGLIILCIVIYVRLNPVIE